MNMDTETVSKGKVHFPDRVNVSNYAVLCYICVTSNNNLDPVNKGPVNSVFQSKNVSFSIYFTV